METIEGKAIKGKGVGKKMGFPTLNIPYKGEQKGVFAAKVFCGKKKYKGAVNIGGAPTLDGKESNKNICEVFLIDAEPNFECKGEIKVELIEKIRDTKRFENKEKLKEQIAKDVKFVKMTPC